MNPSESIKEKIKSFEGLCLKATKCPAGIYTIGYGHTGPEVKMGMMISKEKAEEILKSDLQYFAKGISDIALPRLNQCQFDALVSFTFNCGLGNLKRSTLLKKVRANPDDPDIRKEFARWVYAAGKPLKGLVKRREAEADHYFGII